MIKCICLENVQDKLTGENYVPGKVYEFKEDRAKEVVEAFNGEYFRYEEMPALEKKAKPKAKAKKTEAKNA